MAFVYLESATLKLLSSMDEAILMILLISEHILILIVAVKIYRNHQKFHRAMPMLKVVGSKK